MNNNIIILFCILFKKNFITFILFNYFLYSYFISIFIINIVLLIIMTLYNNFIIK